MNGEHAERGRLLDRFGCVVENWLGIMSRTKKLTAFTASYSQASVIFPYILVAPAYFARKIQLGGMMQTASAFGSVQGALSFFINIYRIAGGLAGRALPSRRIRDVDPERASISRPARPRSSRCLRERRRDRLARSCCCVCRTERRWSRPRLQACAGERTLVTGPSGSGKSTLFRAIAGIWPFGAGSIAVPAGAALMMLPQRPYFPTGSLHGAIEYPAKRGVHRSQISSAMVAIGLPELAERSTRKRTGTGHSRSANSSASASRGRCCMRRTTCSSTRPPPRSTNRRRPRCTAC